MTAVRFVKHDNTGQSLMNNGNNAQDTNTVREAFARAKHRSRRPLSRYKEMSKQQKYGKRRHLETGRRAPFGSSESYVSELFSVSFAAGCARFVVSLSRGGETAVVSSTL